MTYVISDLHGYPLEKFKMLLAKADFGEDDFLYILGDVVDRNNDGGVEILEWLLSQYNVQLILGNHEAMLLSCEFLFDEITDESVAAFDTEKIEILSNYQLNGGDVTLKALSELNKNRLKPLPIFLIISTMHRFTRLLQQVARIIFFAIAALMNLKRVKNQRLSCQRFYLGVAGA